MGKTTAPAARTRAIMGIRALCEGAIMVALSLILGLSRSLSCLRAEVFHWRCFPYSCTVSAGA